MRQIIGPTMLGIGTILVSSMFAVLKSLNHVDPIIRASWRLQTTFLALAVPSAVSIYLRASRSNEKLSILPPLATVWSGCGYALYNVGLCVALAKTSLLRASVLSQCAPLFIVVYRIIRNSCCCRPENENRGVHWKHALGVVLTLVGTGVFVSSTTKVHENQDPEALINNQEPAQERQLGTKSHFMGDLAAAAASIGYATYISCGQQARRSVPVYIHLPGCVFVAMIIVSIVCFATIDLIPFSSLESLPIGDENSDFCSSIFGWTCPQYLPRSAYLGVICGAIAVGLINWSLNLVTALQAAAANSAEPIAASIIGILFFSEPVPDFVAIVAAGIIVLAMLLCSADDGTNEVIASTADNAAFTKSNAKTSKAVHTFSAVQYVLMRGFVALVLMELLLIYYAEDYLPEVQNEAPDEPK